MPEFGSRKSFVLLDAQKINQKLQMANELVLIQRQKNNVDKF